MADTPETTGHLGALTPTQDAKLCEFWVLLFTSVASVLSSVYDVPLPDGPSARLFEALGRVKEPTPDAIIAAIKNPEATASQVDEVSTKTTDPTSTNDAPLDGEQVEANLRSELATRKISTDDFQTLFTQLRKLGVQDADIKSMQQILSSMTPEGMCFAILKMIKQEHPDSLLLRFLRARKWDVGKAFAMLTSNMLWRQQMKVDDDILPNGELYSLQQSRNEQLPEKERKQGRDFIKQLEAGKSFLHGFDRDGRPVNYVRVKIHKPGAQSEEALERYIVHVIESTRLIVVPPVETGTIVFDMTGFSLSNMEYAPVKFIIKCFEANYPESLGRLLIHNAPWVFSSIWRLIQGWMDPVVAQKVQFTKSIKDLDKFIPRDQIPREIGGDEDWQYEYKEPVANEDDALKDTQTRDNLLYERLTLGVKLLAATAAWVSATTEKVNATEIAEIKSRRDAVVAEMSANYWKLDPYLRSRALIDRTGTLKPDGTVVRERLT